MTPPPPPLLEIRQLACHRQGASPLHGVDATFARGEIVALMGESGAGRSTLLQLLAGQLPPDSGTLLWQGNPIVLPSPRAASALGIALARQSPPATGPLTVAETIFLGREPVRCGFIVNQRARDQSAEALLASLGLPLDPAAVVATLPPAHRHMVEIARALAQNPSLLLLDEPTSSLRPRDTDRLFETLGDLQARGVCILYASNRLGEVEALASRVVTLRDGRVAGTLERADLNRESLIKLTAERDLELPIKELIEPGLDHLVVTRLRTTRFPDHEVSFSVREGEVVGLTGLAGSGASELLHTLFGLHPSLGGEVVIDGTRLPGGQPRAALAAGAAFLPGDRTGEGVVAGFSLQENLVLTARPRLAPAGLVRPRAVEKLATLLADHLSLPQETLDQPAGHLAPGQQQKAVLARCLTLKPKVVLLEEPTRGVEIKTKAEIYEIMERFAERGAAVVFLSSDPQEILRLADRALVMRHGRLAGSLTRDDDFTERGLMHLAAGA